MRDPKPTKKISNIQLVALLAMAASVPQGQRTRAVGKPCLCGYGTFRDTHASNCDEPKESEVNDK